MKTSFTTDSRSDKEDSEKESHVETTTTSTTGRKRKRTAGNTAVHDIRITVRCVSSYSETYYSETLNCEYLTTDSRSDKEDSENVESTTTIPTGRKRKRIAGNMAVHDPRITVTYASSYTGT